MPSIESVFYAIGGAALASLVSAVHIRKLAKACQQYRKTIRGKTLLLKSARETFFRKVSLLQKEISDRNKELAMSRGEVRRLAGQVRESKHDAA